MASVSRKPTQAQVRDALIQRLGNLPASVTPEFPIEIRKVVEDLPDPERQLSDLVEDIGIVAAARFSALYGWLLRLRREERFAEYEAIVRRHGREFEREPYTYTFHAIIAKNKGDTSNLRSAVEYSRHAAKLMPDVAGVIHQLAAFMVEYFERSESVVDSEISEAERSVDQAIALTHGQTSHYFETKARILAIRGDFPSARVAIGQAIELEPRTSRDYQRRLTEYQTTRIRIDLLQQRSYWNKQQEETRRELVEFKAQQLQLLGLLAAVVAFVATTGNIASKTDPVNGLKLIEAMAGSIIIVFASFSLVSTRSIWRVIFVYGVGLLLLAFPHLSWR
jgi:hypothetical protein